METVQTIVGIVVLIAALSGAGAVILLFIAHVAGFRRIVVREPLRALQFVKGRLVREIGAGRYMYNKFRTTFEIFDTRLRYSTVPGQEVLTADSVSIKLSAVAEYRIADAEKMFRSVSNSSDSLYVDVQLAVREAVGGLTIDELLAQRNQIGAKLLDRVAQKAETYGLSVTGLDLKDIMFPGALRETFAKVVTAQKEGLAALERARGESAALRNLANAARVLQDNPGLLQLRLIQTIGETTGNTIVLGAPADMMGRGGNPAGL